MVNGNIMKNWLWFLGISILVIFYCGERSVADHSASKAPAVNTVVSDTPPPAVLPSAPKNDQVERNQDTNQQLPIVHMGDKDYNPNRERNRALEDSLWKAQTAQQRVRDSIWRAHHPPLPGDTMKSRQRR